jgi:hypothetical protein
LAALLVCLTTVAAMTAPANDPAAADQDSAALLQKVVQQIAAGRTVTPLEDNALTTWEGVRKRAQPMTPGTARALKDFVSLSESRAISERQAGRDMVAFDLQAFADMAQELLQRNAGHAVAAEAQPTPIRAEPPATAVPLGNVPLANNVPPPLIEPAAASVKGSTSDTVIALAVPKPPAPPRAPPVQDRTAALLISRGDAMLAIKDISAARKLYELAANLGSAVAAKGLARTYDPGFVSKLGIVGMRPDVTLAASWYDRAAALGDREAAQRMQDLDAMAETTSSSSKSP